MVRVSELAQITARAPEGAGELESQAYAVWTVAHAAGQKQRRSPVSGRPGLLYERPLSSIVQQLWPHLDKEVRASIRRDVYQLLRASDNAHCVSSSAVDHTATWWVADTWNRPQGVVISRSYRPSSTERKLTPAEAGEDREAAPVETRTVEKSAPPENALTRRWEEARERRRSVAESVVESLATAGQPLIAEEILHDAQLEVNISTLRGIIADLLADGKVFERQETRDERMLRCGGTKLAKRAMLYSTLDPVPERTVREAVPGYVDRPTASRTHANRTQHEQRIARALRASIRRGAFSASEFAERGDIPVGTVHSVLERLTGDALVTVVGDDRPRRWRIAGAQEAAVRAYIDARLGVTKQRTEPTPPPPTSPVPAAKRAETSGTSMTAEEALSVLAQVTGAKLPQPDTAALERRVRELETECNELRQKLNTMRQLLGGA